MRIGSFLRSESNIHTQVTVAGDIGLMAYVGHRKRVRAAKVEERQFERMMRQARFKALLAQKTTRGAEATSSAYGAALAAYQAEQAQYSRLTGRVNTLGKSYTRLVKQWTDREASTKRKTVLEQGAPTGRIYSMNDRLKLLTQVQTQAYNALSRQQQNVQQMYQGVQQQQRQSRQAIRRSRRHNRRINQRWGDDEEQKKTDKGKG